jgi:hypothetical protein
MAMAGYGSHGAVSNKRSGTLCDIPLRAPRGTDFHRVNRW